MLYICTRNDASATVGCSSAKAKQARLRTHHLARQLQRHSKDKILLLREKGCFNLGKKLFFSEKAKRTLRVNNWDVAPRNHPKATEGRGITTWMQNESPTDSSSIGLINDLWNYVTYGTVASAPQPSAYGHAYQSRYQYLFCCIQALRIPSRYQSCVWVT